MTGKSQFRLVRGCKGCLGQMTLQNDASVAQNSFVEKAVLCSAMVSRLLVNVLFGEYKALVIAGCTEVPLQLKGQLCCHLITYYRETHLKLFNVLFINLLLLLNTLLFGN